MTKANDHVTAPSDLPASSPVDALVNAGRPALEAVIELLVLLLDRQEPDADIEPSLAGADSDLEHDESLDEPSLGAVEVQGSPHGNYWHGLSQAGWSRGGMNDLEHDRDDFEPGEDEEPDQQPCMPDNFQIERARQERRAKPTVRVRAWRLAHDPKNPGFYIPVAILVPEGTKTDLRDGLYVYPDKPPTEPVPTIRELVNPVPQGRLGVWKPVPQGGAS